MIVSGKPLLSLVMIVKNEAKSIQRTIASARPFVDRYTILDTGSTDGTQDLVSDALSAVPGELHQEPFVDYGATRSRALDLEGQRSTFALMLSGDEELFQGEALRRFCEAHHASQGHEHGAYRVRMHWGPSTRFDLERLTRTEARWRYVGATHEYLTKPGTPPASIRVPNAFIHHDSLGADPVRKRATWENDRKILEAELAQHPDDPRTTFYLAQTLEDLGLSAEASDVYLKRIQLGGWHEEVFEARLRLARCRHRAGASFDEVERLYLLAHEFSAHRAEPLVELGERLLERRQYAQAYLFGRRAQELPFPESDGLFIDESVYSHRADHLVGAAAFYVGEFERGRRALEKALQVRPNDPSLLSDLAHYQRRERQAPKSAQEANERASRSRLVLPRQLAAAVEHLEGWLSPGEVDLLIASSAEAIRSCRGEVVEVGSYCGRSTVALASVVRALAPTQKVHAIDPHEGQVGQAGDRPGESTLVRFRNNVARAGLGEWVRLWKLHSTKVSWSAPISFLFIDGLHDYESVSADYRHFQPFLAPDAWVAFHDYADSWPGVRRFVDELLDRRDVSLVSVIDSLAVVRQ